MKKLIILEGPDGGGKTTLGKILSSKLEVPVDNHGPYKGEVQIWKHYFDSMLPAYSGERNVILDRCWLAEGPYGQVYRGGLNRIERWQQRILEHVAVNCSAVVIYCLPPYRECLRAWSSGREEMLETEAQLCEVYDLYQVQAAGKIGFADVIYYDWTMPDAQRFIDEQVVS